jgi:hypothetical protein
LIGPTEAKNKIILRAAFAFVNATRPYRNFVGLSLRDQTFRFDTDPFKRTRGLLGCEACRPYLYAG